MDNRWTTGGCQDGRHRESKWLFTNSHTEVLLCPGAAAAPSLTHLPHNRCVDVVKLFYTHGYTCPYRYNTYVQSSFIWLMVLDFDVFLFCLSLISMSRWTKKKSFSLKRNYRAFQDSMKVKASGNSRQDNTKQSREGSSDAEKKLHHGWHIVCHLIFLVNSQRGVWAETKLYVSSINSGCGAAVVSLISSFCRCSSSQLPALSAV